MDCIKTLTKHLFGVQLEDLLRQILLVYGGHQCLSERINYASFANNQKQIESDWDINFGDRKIELVFIGQELDVLSITKRTRFMFVK